VHSERARCNKESSEAAKTRACRKRKPVCHDPDTAQEKLIGQVTIQPSPKLKQRIFPIQAMPARREGIQEENQKQIGLRPFLVGDDDGLTSWHSSSAATGITTGEACQVPHASDSPPAATGYHTVEAEHRHPANIAGAISPALCVVQITSVHIYS
jgi:hypothetical protein